MLKYMYKYYTQIITTIQDLLNEYMLTQLLVGQQYYNLYVYTCNWIEN